MVDTAPRARVGPGSAEPGLRARVGSETGEGEVPAEGGRRPGDKPRRGPGSRAESRIGPRGRAFLCLLALTVLAFAFQGARGIWQPDEGRYTAVALQMLESRDWVHPRLAPELPHYTKPPLVYWGIAAAIETFGRQEWAARLVSILSFLGTTALVYAIALRLRAQRPGQAALIHAMMLGPAIASGVVTTDPPLTLFETLGVFGFVALWWRDGRGRLVPSLILGLGFGLAFLTKGPPGLLPIAAILAFAWIARGAAGWKELLSWPGAIAFLLVGGSWYAVVIHDQPALLGHLLSEEVYARLVDPSVGRNAEWYGPFKMYLPILLVGTLPWTVHLLRAAFGARKLVRPERWRLERDRDPATVFLLLWLLLPLLALSISRSRLPLYVLPSFVPIALLLERRAGARWEWTRAPTAALCAWLVLLLSVRFVLGSVESARDARPFARAIVAAMPTHAREIVFVDERPWYGLAFYLDSDVEQCAATEHYAATHPELERVAEEMAEDDDPRIWALNADAQTVDEFQKIARQTGRTPREVARWKDLVVYETRPSP